MYLINRHTKSKEKALILLASAIELKLVDKSGRFNFKWKTESKKSVYKLQLDTTGEIVGLMAIEDIPRELRINIHVLESSKENVGRNKTYEGIAGSLIAFACRMAFQNGYGGFVSLTQKTLLKQHYKELFGFVEMGTKLCSYDEISETLIEKYLES